jgi:hypothetical protein
LSQLKGNEFQKFPSVDNPCTRGLDLGEVPFIPGHEKVSLPGYRAGDELVVIRIGRSSGNWDRIKEVAMAAEQIEHVIDLVLRKPKPWAKKNVGVFLRYLAGKTWRNQSLVDRHDEQGFISRR